MPRGLAKKTIAKTEVAVLTGRKSKNRIDMSCFFCGRGVKVDENTKAALCDHCVARLAGTPVEIGKAPKTVDALDVVKKQRVKRGSKKVVVKKTAGFGRGWHLKKHFVAPNGKTYSFGQEV